VPRETIFATIPVRTHGRYIIDTPDGDGPFPLLVGFHGYAENAERNLEQLRRIASIDGWTLAAVQALHWFYTSRNDVVASWMTRLERELAIADNLAYVRAAVDTIRKDVPATGPLVFIGFSQGAAMAYRAAASVDCQGLVILGGEMPPELRDGSARLPRTLLARGSAEEWFTAEQFDRDRAILAARAANVDTLTFDGGHEWHSDFLSRVSEFLLTV
jgi:dienelactone hydrolase